MLRLRAFLDSAFRDSVTTWAIDSPSVPRDCRVVFWPTWYSARPISVTAPNSLVFSKSPLKLAWKSARPLCRDCTERSSPESATMAPGAAGACALCS